ncbi:hypothetical protein HZC30_04925 [Candidatus Woesearchaeota archaeon]|nr:hypothetical protein [Candidatus Woesearchaeota archaeon]
MNCCKPDPKPLKQSIIYGIIPHIGCIAFIIGSIFGVTILMQWFKPLLMNRYFFYMLIAASLTLTTLSAMLYLKKNQLLSMRGIKCKWGYLTLMYILIIGINLLLFTVIFPALTNVNSVSDNQLTGNAVTSNTLLTLAVDIPCPGHAPLIIQELNRLNGISQVKYSFPNVFKISYDSNKITVEQILKLNTFEEFTAKEIK